MYKLFVELLSICFVYGPEDLRAKVNEILQNTIELKREIKNNGATRAFGISVVKTKEEGVFVVCFDKRGFYVKRQNGKKVRFFEL